MGNFHAIHYPMGNYPKKNSMGTPQFFPMGNSLLFYPKNLMGNPHLFFTYPLMGNSQKNLEKNFFFGIYGQLFPQKWGCPLGRGGMGGYLPPPMGYMGGGDYLFGCLFGYYLFSVLLISFFLAVSDAMLSFIFVTFLLWRYLL